MNKLLLYSLSLFFLGHAAETAKKEGIFVSHKLDFIENKNDEPIHGLSKLHDYDFNKVLHFIDHAQFENLEGYNETKLVNDAHDESHSLIGKENMKSTAARFWLTKLAIHATVQTAYALIAGATSLVYPAAAPIVYCSLQLTFASFVDHASTFVASETIKS